MTTLKLSSKNQIVIPKEARKAMKIKGGDQLLVVVKGELAILMPKPRKFSEALSGKGRGIYPDRYLRKERKSW